MAEMTNEEAREIIGNLLDSIETGFVLAAAQKAVLTAQAGKGWESQVVVAQEIYQKAFREVFSRIRGILLSTSSEIPLPVDWQQMVRELLESVDGLDLSG